MNFRGRTVAFFVIVSMVFSSLATALLVGDGGVLDQLSGKGTLESGNFTSGQGAAGFDQYASKLKKAYSLIKSNYVHNVSDEQLIDGAIQGMVEALGDPYSAYMDPKQAGQFKEDLKSSFTGIGAEVTMKNGRLTIVSPIKGSPAEKAGLRPEDQVIKVNGESLEGLDLTKAVSKIRGPKGTKANLEIVRPGVRDILHISVVRDEISLATVEAEMLPEQLGRITISQFSENTAEDFEKELKKLEQQGMKGLVIDVRGNPGGLLPVVLKICDQLVPGNKTVMMTEDKKGNRTKHQSKLDKRKPYPITVLIDKGSASASEILAAALKEAAGYPLVGETTFGKGTVQSAEDFEDGSNIKLTMAKWLTPNGNWVDQRGGSKGIKPDYPVKLPDYVYAIPPQPSTPLKLDTNSVEVKNMQIVLDALGFNPGRKDGYFDSQTQLAVKAFQKTKNLPTSGQLDTATADQLRKAFGEMLRQPKNDVQLQVAIQVLKKNVK
ncbi:S41 family peptidase [Lihuaxuella thermophila]|uniref:Carboxyl-terminal processing protease n=1 Tax=Lihuaxuella thermophila TaxID=1173111 RepID=A0A1H8GUE6_9BACL|nr:carboxyl-terminal processing protease [Lihuaxuella thermophila]